MTSIKNLRQHRPHILFVIICLVLGLSNCDHWFDLVPPKVQILEPEEGTAYFASFPCRVRASDNYGVKSVEVFVNDELVHTFTKEPYTTEIDYLNWFGKTATLKAIAYDRAGNFSNEKREIQFSYGFQLISPNGGEQWQEQSLQEITWKSAGNIGSNVALDYTIDGGESWHLIVESTEDNGFYAWTLPNLMETAVACQVRICAVSTEYTDTSDSNFIILAEPNTIAVTSPNGGEVWEHQSIHPITWDRNGDVGDYVSLHYSVDGGVNWIQVIASTENDSSFTWTLPAVGKDATACRVKVASTSTNHSDISDADFTITKGEITITSPNGGENWREWSTHTITWTSSGDEGGYVSLHYSMDGGTTWTEITTSTLNNGSYSWTLPTISANQTACRVKVSNTTTGDYDASDGNFTMENENWVPILAGSYDTPGTAYGVFVSGGYAYVADRSSLQIINVSNPASPTMAGSYDTPGSLCYSVFVSGSYAYVANRSSGSVVTHQDLQVINVSDPASPTLAGSYDTPGWATDVFVSGGYAYVADGLSGLEVINVSNPASPTLAGSYNTPYYAQGVFVSRGYAYVGVRCLQVINVSNPASPTLAGYYDTPGSPCYSVFVSGSYAYVVDYQTGLQIIDVSNPASPTLTGSYDTPDNAYGVFVSGSYAYVVDYQTGLLIIDVSNPNSPTLAGSYETPSFAWGVFVSGGYAYVAGHLSGLLIFDVSGLP